MYNNEVSRPPHRSDLTGRELSAGPDVNSRRETFGRDRGRVGRPAHNRVADVGASEVGLSEERTGWAATEALVQPRAL